MGADGQRVRPVNAPGPEAHRILARLELVLARRIHGLVQGEHQGLFAGAGSEPGESRPYVPGDDVRLLDWNVTARTGLPHVRDPVADHEVDLWLVADMSASQHFGTTVREKREVVVAVAAGFGLPATRLANRVGAVVIAGGRAHGLPAAAGRRQLLSLLHRMITATASGDEGRTDLVDAIDTLRGLARRRGVVVLISDFLVSPGWESALGSLALGHDVVVVEIVDPREQEIPAVGIMTLVDPETGRTRVVDTSRRRLRTAFARAAACQRARVADAARRAGADHLVVSTDDDWLGAILVFFDQRRRRRGYRPGGDGGQPSW
jgi:uncharacterized protein (DUF58 family)